MRAPAHDAAFRAAASILEDGVRSLAFPCAVAEVGGADGVVWREAFGALSRAPDAPVATADTV
ncbi:MAG: hypothetical protein AB7I50_18365, partial [Vicinamibacterales bacterium]